MKDRNERPTESQRQDAASTEDEKRSPDTVLQEERSIRERTARKGNFIEMERNDPNDIDRLKGPL